MIPIFWYKISSVMNCKITVLVESVSVIQGKLILGDVIPYKVQIWGNKMLTHKFTCVSKAMQ